MVSSRRALLRYADVQTQCPEMHVWDIGDAFIAKRLLSHSKEL